MRKILSAVLPMALGLAACATSGSSANLANPNRVVLADGSIMICELERTTGSNIRERVCHREEGASAADKEAAREVLSRPPVQMAK